MPRKTAQEKYFEREKEIIGSSTVDFTGPVITEGHGVIGKNLNGEEFLDFTAQISLLNTGYAPKEVVSAICQTAKKVHSNISADWPYLIKIRINGKTKEISRVAIAERLIAITSNVMPFPKKRVHFEVSGATAVNLALKIAKITYQRKQGIKTEDFNKFFQSDIFIPSQEDLFKFSILGFEPGSVFHGRHGDPQCLTNSKVRQLWAASSSCAFGRLPFPSPRVNKKYFWKKTNEIIDKLCEYAPIVAFVFEPVQGEGGIRVPDGELLAELVTYLRNKNIYIIADEIQSGLGRTGRMWACEHFGIQPDMLCTSKSLGAGIPTGAVVVDAEKFPDLEPGMHSGSHHATPLAAAAGIVSIDLIIEKELVKNSASCGAYTMVILKAICGGHPEVIDVRGLGLMIGIEFVSTDYRDKVIKHCKANGLLLASAGSKTIRVTPPLIVTVPQIDKALYVIGHALASLE